MKLIVGNKMFSELFKTCRLFINFCLARLNVWRWRSIFEPSSSALEERATPSAANLSQVFKYFRTEKPKNFVKSYHQFHPFRTNYNIRRLDFVHKILTYTSTEILLTVFKSHGA